MAAKDDTEGLKSAADKLKGDFDKINKSLKDTKALLNDAISPFESLNRISEQLLAHKTNENKLSAEELKNLALKVKAEQDNLFQTQKALKERQKFLKDELKANKANSKAYQSVSAEIKQNAKAQADLNKQINITSGEVENLEKQLEKASGQMKGFEELKKVGGTLDKISTPLDGMLNPMNLINKLIGFVIGNAVQLDTELGNAAKSMNMTYEAAGKSRLEMTRFAKATKDTLVNSTHLQESVLSINESLGSNVAFEQMSSSFQKDVAFLSKMSHFAGLTAEESNNIAKLTLATGQSAEKFTGELMGQVQASGLQKGLILNEKTALKEISKTSAAIKMSFHGSAKGLGDAYAKAKALGTSLEKVDDIAGSLLNFEESIEAELSAELLTGKDLNLEKAREAALNNDIATVAEEIAKNVGSAADFAKMNRIQQDAIAKSVGMTREELASSLQEQESLKAIGAASVEDAKAKYDKLVETYGIEEATKRLGDEKLAQQFEQQTIQEKLGAAQLTMADSMNEELIPALTTINKNFNDMWNRIKDIITKLGGMKTILVIIGGIMAAKMIKGIWDFASGVGKAIKAAQALATVEKQGAIASIISGAWKSMGAIPFVGAVLATAAVGAGIAYLMSQMNAAKVNDGVIGPSGSGGYGSRVLYGPEGAISFNNKDTIVAGTDLFKTDDMVSAPKGTVQVGGGNQSKDIAELKSAIMALASRPVDVAIDGTKVIEATTGRNPNTQGLESAKNSFKMQ